jgi:hypothetical protein
VLERPQESDEVVFVLLRKVKAETDVVKTDGILQGSGGAVMEIGGAPRQAAENRAFDLPHVVDLPSIKAWPRSVVVLQLLVGTPVVASFLHTVISGR